MKLTIKDLLPGTSAAACGGGWRDAMIGKFVGASVCVAAFPTLRPMIQSMADFGKAVRASIRGNSTPTPDRQQHHGTRL